MSSKNSSRGSTALTLLVTGLIIAATAWILINRQYVVDTLHNLQFTPSASIAAINNTVGFTEKGTFYFYTGAPELNSGTEFNNNCQRQEPQSAILGCYSSGRIFIFDVENSQLEGIEEVTAAHEMLHAVWERKSESEKQTIGALLDTAYTSVVTPALEKRMAYYDRTEPGERQNELHSILGTEFTTLNPELESYYDEYFKERNTIVSLHQNYQKVFDEITAQSDKLYQEINAEAPVLERDTAEYNQEVAAINSAIIQLQQRAESLDRTNAQAVNQYNRDRATLLVRADRSDQTRRQLVARSELFNQKVAQYNALIIRSNELTSSLDSTIQPAPSL